MTSPDQTRFIDRSDPQPNYIEFEGVRIQRDKSKWNFNNPEQGPISIDTYSIWSPSQWNEIALRLMNGETCALYMMGNFGVARLFDLHDKTGEDKITDDIKQREKVQKLVGFVHPDDSGDLIDFERLPEGLRNLQDAQKRHELYKGPMHAIFPLKDAENVNPSIAHQQDNTIALFWIPGHWGYEGLARDMKKKGAQGILGGGSLNIHGAEPSYTTEALHEQFERIPEWQHHIDFVIFDEIAEAAGIGRSHTMVSFVQDPPKAVRIGSMSLGRIGREIGFEIVVEEGVKMASSLTEYTDENNAEIDRKVDDVLAQMQRYREWLSESGK